MLILKSFWYLFFKHPILNSCIFGGIILFVVILVFMNERSKRKKRQRNIDSTGQKE